MGASNAIVYELDPRPPEPTGILDHNGNMVFREYAEKPPIGFVTPPELAPLYECDPEVDYFYTTVTGDV